MATKKYNDREYVLKPGKHQFAPGSHAHHDNDNTSDEECAWYLDKFPHIKALFEKVPKKPKTSPEAEA